MRCCSCKAPTSNFPGDPNEPITHPHGEATQYARCARWLAVAMGALCQCTFDGKSVHQPQRHSAAALRLHASDEIALTESYAGIHMDRKLCHPETLLICRYGVSQTLDQVFTAPAVVKKVRWACRARCGQEGVLGVLGKVHLACGTLCGLPSADQPTCMPLCYNHRACMSLSGGSGHGAEDQPAGLMHAPRHLQGRPVSRPSVALTCAHALLAFLQPRRCAIWSGSMKRTWETRARRQVLNSFCNVPVLKCFWYSC